MQVSEPEQDNMLRELIPRDNLQQEERSTENFEQKFNVEREKNQNLQSIIQALKRTVYEQRARIDYLQNVSQSDFTN